MSSSNRQQAILTTNIGVTLFSPEDKSTSSDPVKKILQHTAKCDYNVQFIKSGLGVPHLEIDTLYVNKFPNGDVIYLFKTKEDELTKEFINAKHLHGDVQELLPHVLNHIKEKHLQVQEYDYNIRVVSECRVVSEDTLYLIDNKEKDKIEYHFMFNNRLINGDIDKKKLASFMSTEEWLSKVFAYINENKKYQPPLRAVAMARKNPALVLKKSTFQEEWCGGRNWLQPLSALQYAAWAGDTPMVDEFLETVTPDMKEVALQQLLDVRDFKIQRPHLFAIEQLIGGYELLSLDRYHEEDEWTSLTTKLCWPVIRDRQFRSVVNLIQQFCSSTPFSPLPTFKEFPETRSLVARKQCPSSFASANIPTKMYETDDQLIDTQLLWTSHHVDPSSISSFGNGLTKGYVRACTSAEIPLLSYIEADYKALTEYCRLRKLELDAQIKVLQTSLENQPASLSPR